MKEDNIALSKLCSKRQIFAKICRLCEGKDGPFLNIFDSSTIGLAKQIEELMFITIAECDDLPHKVCFRCSAKVSDLYEFVEKCKATQKSLMSKLGKKVAEINKNKAISSWEAKLNKKKLSNDEFCDELVKKALESVAREGIVKNIKLPVILPKEKEKEALSSKCEIAPKTPDIEDPKEKLTEPAKTSNEKPIEPQEKKPIKPQEEKPITIKNANLSLYKVDNPMFGLVPNESGNYFLKNFKTPPKKVQTNIPKSNSERPLPHHVSSLKVSGLGLVFNCSLCKYIFVDKEKAASHKCPKLTKSSSPRILKNSKSVNSETSRINSAIPSTSKNLNYESNREPFSTPNSVRQKPGPASRRRPQLNVSNNYLSVKKDLSAPPPIDLTCDDYEKPSAPAPSSISQSLQTQSCFLVPIGNNSFELRLSNAPPPTSSTDSTFNFSSLMSGQVSQQNNEFNPQSYSPSAVSPKVPVPGPSSTQGFRPQISKMSIKNTPYDTTTSNAKMSVPTANTETIVSKKNGSDMKPKRGRPPKYANKPTEAHGPYPVGLLYRNNSEAKNMDPEPLPIADDSSTNAKGKSNVSPQYKVIPSKGSTKLVISSVASKGNVVYDNETEKNKNKSKRKRSSGSNTETVKIESSPELVDNIEETVPENRNYFTYVNIDPMAKISTGYVLPTKSVVQEPQISTTNKGTTLLKKETPQTQLPHKKRRQTFSCSICDLEFSNEKKMVAHVRTHYEGFDDDSVWE